MLKQTPLNVVSKATSKRYLAEVCTHARECASMTEMELVCTEKRDRKIVDPILVKASYKSLRESDCWCAGVGTLIP